MELRYNEKNDTFEKIETLSSDSIDQQIILWQNQINEKLAEIQNLNDQISSIQPLKDQRDVAIQTKGQIDISPMVP